MIILLNRKNNIKNNLLSWFQMQKKKNLIIGIRSQIIVNWKEHHWEILFIRKFM